MGTGRTLNKNPRTRPIKSQGDKRRRTKAQRDRLVKWGLDEAVVVKMETEVVRKLVQQPSKVKKMLAPKVAKPVEEAAAAEPAKKVSKTTKAKAPKADKPTE